MQLRTIGLATLTTLTTSLAFAATPAVPKAVQSSVAAIFGAQRPAIEHEREGGADKYEVGAPTRLEVVLDAQGVVEEVEVKIPVGLLPPAVMTAARNALPKDARVEQAELLVRGTQLLYEVEARVATGEVEVILDPGGTIVSQHTEQDDDEERDD